MLVVLFFKNLGLYLRAAVITFPAHVPLSTSYRHHTGVVISHSFEASRILGGDVPPKSELKKGERKSWEEKGVGHRG